MNEDFLHYVWKFQKFHATDLVLEGGETLQVSDPGTHNHHAGPDFSNARMYIDGIEWTGQVEIHLNSSDWYSHQHHNDANYDNVILHVVWNYEVAIYRSNDSRIPTLVLKGRVFKAVLSSYQQLVQKKNTWINCEPSFPFLNDLQLCSWIDRLYLERLQRKTTELMEHLKKTRNHWEQLLFQMLSRNFGLKVNADSFESIASSLPFAVVMKIASDPLALEALLMGQAGLLNDHLEDAYFLELKEHYEFFRRKYTLKQDSVVPPKFFRLRPSNFPTVRLSQLSVLWSARPHLFSEYLEVQDVKKLYELFRISASYYWNDHYTFGHKVSGTNKRLTPAFVDILILNTLIPVKFAYFRAMGKDVSNEVLEMAASIKPESNGIINSFAQLGYAAGCARDGQALLELKQGYCVKNRCYSCAIGTALMNR